MFAKTATKYVGVCLLFGFLLLGFQSKVATSDKRPVDYANALVGTAPLDDPKLIGNAPPPGEELYTGFTSPGAVLPHSSTNLSPINKNLDVAYPAGVNYPYVYPHRTMIGFSSGDSRGAGGGFTIMPVVGDWTVPPERTASFYDKAKEKAAPGYYTAFLDDYNTKVEMTATTWTGIFRFTFPATNRAHVILDLGRTGGDVEIVGDRTVHGHRVSAGRGRGGNNFGGGASFYVAEFSKPFKAFGVFKQVPSSAGRLRPGFHVGQQRREAGEHDRVRNLRRGVFAVRHDARGAGSGQSGFGRELRGGRKETGRKRIPAGTSTRSISRRKAPGPRS